jgi:hypothetical protein
LYFKIEWIAEKKGREKMPNTSKESYKGKTIFVTRFVGETAQLVAQIDEAAKIIRSQPKASVYLLSDITKAKYSQDVVDALKTYVRDNKPYVVKSAVIGLNPMTRFIMNVVAKFGGRDLKAFNTEAEAKDYLIH